MRYITVTFEDRRKENFDKGQAELERRRQMLQEQMKRENEARMEKERQEQEKREKIRYGMCWYFIYVSHKISVSE